MSLMYRTTVVVTGVAGSPYYLTGYALASAGTAADAGLAWVNFCNPGATRIPAAATLTFDGQVYTVESTTRQVTGAFATTPQFIQGTNSSDFMPPANQLLMRWKTGAYLAGREIQGRTNLPWAVEAGAVAGQVGVDERVFFNNKATTYLGTSGVTPVIFAKTAGTEATITSGSCWEQYSVLRSRRD